MHFAARDVPVTRKFLTVSGAVREPKSFWAPVGTAFRDLLAAAGGTTADDFGLLVSGIMMGTLTFDLDDVVTKTCAGLIVLPRERELVTRKAQPIEEMHRIGKSACDQCSYCTEFCPRYLLGYEVMPHKVMRSLGYSASGAELWNQWAQLCCACGLCTLYACPEGLFPKEACDQAKRDMRAAGVKFTQSSELRIHPMKDGAAEASRYRARAVPERLHPHLRLRSRLSDEAAGCDGRRGCTLRHGRRTYEPSSNDDRARRTVRSGGLVPFRRGAARRTHGGAH